MSSLLLLKKELRSKGTSEKAKNSARFFKTGKGQYGEGDVFVGVTVPETRMIIKKYQDLDLKSIQKLLTSKFHEERLGALMLLVLKYKKADEKMQKQIFDVYLASTKFINNWDLVDLSAEHIVGPYLLNRNKNILTKLATSKDVWKKRIAILSTFHYIKIQKYEETLRIAEVLMNDSHDLIHKAVGWMLREVGKRCNEKILENFLDKYATQMPRTMLRYAIERLAEKKRNYYLQLRAT